MLTRALYLSLLWLIVSFLSTFAVGTRVRRSQRRSSLLWLAAVLFVGDLWALYTFALPLEVAGLTVAMALFGWFWIRRLPDWNALGQVTWAATLATVALYVAFSFAVTAFTPLRPLAFLLAVIFFFVELAALGLALTFSYESLDRTCRVRWRRRVDRFPDRPDYVPMASLHVPTYNEPPEVVAETLRALADLDYPNYEVLLIDNNTPAEEKWRPVEQLCRELGPRFHFLHLDKWPGYKSGALNFGLTQCHPDTEIIGIVDADYLVDEDFLRALTPAFADPQVAFVQTPQDYRDFEDNPYLEACYQAYKYFFDVSMLVRNEHNAIIFGGTMGLIRKRVLQEIGGWDEWCITEDAEASLRMLKLGYRSHFINKTYGRGLMPFTFEGLKKQRFRWCFGGIQILKKHWLALMPWAPHLEPDRHLTAAQRYFYLAGGLQWFGDLLNLFFVAFLLLGAAVAISPLQVLIRPLIGPFLVVPAVFLLLGLWRFVWVLRHALGSSYRQALTAMGNYFGLGWSVALGVIEGLRQPEGVFMRTPKSRSRSGLVRAVRATQWETAIGLACLLAAATVALLDQSAIALFLMALLLWQAGLYLAAPANSLASVRGRAAVPLISRADIFGLQIRESRAARGALLLLFLLLLGGLVVWLTPKPAQPPLYASLQPAKVPPARLLGLERVPFERRALDRLEMATPPPPAAASATATVPADTSPTPNLTVPAGATTAAAPGGGDQPGPTASGPAPPGTGPPPATATPTSAATPTSTALPGPTSSPTPTDPAPTAGPTLPPTPSAVPTAPPAPTAIPTQPPPPTEPAPTAVPTQPPAPTEPAPPPTPTTPTGRP